MSHHLPLANHIQIEIHVYQQCQKRCLSVRWPVPGQIYQLQDASVSPISPRPIITNEDWSPNLSLNLCPEFLWEIPKL